MSEYSELFKDPCWQKRRLGILKRDGWKCVSCGDNKTTLNVHHKWYTMGLKPWEYSGNCLVTLCETCHKLEHEIKKDSISSLVEAFLGSGMLYNDLLAISSKISDMSEEETYDLLFMDGANIKRRSWLVIVKQIESLYVGSTAPMASQIVDGCLAIKDGLPR